MTTTGWGKPCPSADDAEPFLRTTVALKRWEPSVPQHLNPLGDRRVANRRAAGSVAVAFVVALIFFGGFYLWSQLRGPSTSGATSTEETH